MPLLSVRDLAIRFGGLTALGGLSFSQDEGQILGLIGPNGSGKTTVFNCMTGVYKPDRGAIEFAGIDLLARPTYGVVAAGVARTFQNLELFSTMSVLENVLVGQHRTIGCNLFDCAFSLPRALRGERRARRRAGEVLDFLGLQVYRDTPVTGLPFGVKKKVELARALVAEPRLLLLDEPANGLSEEDVVSLAGQIRALRDEFRLTMVLVEHNMHLVMNVSDRVCVLNFGTKIFEGTPAEAQRDPAVAGAYLGAAHA